MARSPDERIESLERKLNLWRIFAVLMVVLLLLVQRKTIGGWVDGVEGWMGNVSGRSS